MTAPPKPWTRTTGRRPCPVCHRGSGCFLSGPSDPAAIVCARVSSEVQIGAAGHLHEIRPSPTWASWRSGLARLRKTGTQ